MKPLYAEWGSFITQNPNVRHDDDGQRNRDFYDSPAGCDLITEVLTKDTTVPARDGHNIPIRIYTAKGQGFRHGVVIFHSGGFTGGFLETEDGTLEIVSESDYKWSDTIDGTYTAHADSWLFPDLSPSSVSSTDSARHIYNLSPSTMAGTHFST